MVGGDPFAHASRSVAVRVIPTEQVCQRPKGLVRQFLRGARPGGQRTPVLLVLPARGDLLGGDSPIPTRSEVARFFARVVAALRRSFSTF